MIHSRLFVVLISTFVWLGMTFFGTISHAQLLCFGPSGDVGSTKPPSVRPSPDTGSHVVGRVAADYSIPNTLNSQQRKWEQILDQPAAGKFRSVSNVQELLVVLRRLGLPVMLAESATLDLLTLDEPISFSFDGVSIRAVLQQGLSDKNGALCMKSDRLLIISLDDAEDYEYLNSVSYDVSRLVSDSTSLEQLVQTLYQTVSPESWEISQGLGTAAGQVISGRRILTVQQTYEGHRRVQEFFASLNKLRGRPLSLTTSIRSRDAGSRVVRSRSNPVDADGRSLRAKSGGFGGGVGGYGLGGGVF